MNVSSLPPKYVNVSVAATYDQHLSDVLFRTLSRLCGLAWRSADKATLPPLREKELCGLLHCSRSTLHEHLRRLQEGGWLRYQSRKGVFSIRLLMPGEEQDLTDTLQANLDALRSFGVDTQKKSVQKIAQLPHVTPELIRAWGDYLRTLPHVKNLPGYLLTQVERNIPLPTVAPSSRTQSHPLPEDVEQRVLALGWADDIGEIADYYAREPERTLAWLEAAARSRVSNKAGFLRKRLREGNWPPKATPARKYNLSFEDEVESHPRPQAPPIAAADIPAEVVEQWRFVRMQLQQTMPKDAFERHIRPLILTGCHHGEFTFAAPDADSVAWLRDRMTAILQRQLLSDHPVRVQFVEKMAEKVT